MAALGSGINAGLGRIDYSPIARGGEAAARGIMGAANTRAQGVMAIGQGLAQGIQTFQKKKEEKKLMEQASIGIEGFLVNNPQLAQSMGAKISPDGDIDDGMIKSIVTTYGGPKAAMQAIGQMSQQLKIAGMEQQKIDNQKAFQSAAQLLSEKRFGLDSTIAANNMAMQGVNAGMDARRIEQGDRRLDMEARRFQAEGERAPTGMRWADKEKTRLEPIPGGVIEYERNMHAKMAEEQALKIADSEARQIEAANTVLGEINDVQTIINNAVSLLEAGTMTSGVSGAATKYWPGRDANTLDSMYSQIRSQVVLKTLTQLKTLSKTGATGFGQMNEKEFAALENRFGELATSKTQAQQRSVLGQIYKGLEDLKAGIRMDLPQEESETTRRARAIVGIN